MDFDVNPIDVWPQHHIGVVLWSLSVAGQDRSDAGALTRACTILDTIGTPCAAELPDDATVSRVLRPLLWLGPVESRDQNHGTKFSADDCYRKTALFDGLLTFAVSLRDADDVRQRGAARSSQAGADLVAEIMIAQHQHAQHDRDRIGPEQAGNEDQRDEAAHHPNRPGIFHGSPSVDQSCRNVNRQI